MLVRKSSEGCVSLGGVCAVCSSMGSAGKGGKGTADLVAVSAARIGDDGNPACRRRQPIEQESGIDGWGYLAGWALVVSTGASNRLLKSRPGILPSRARDRPY